MIKREMQKCRLTLGNLNHVPSSHFNLFSASQAINQGWEVHVKSDKATVRKGNQTLTFDYVVTTGTSQLYAMRFVPEGTQEDTINLSVCDGEKMDFPSAEENEKKMSELLDPDPLKVDTMVQAAVVMSPRARKITKLDAVAAAKHIGHYDVLLGGSLCVDPAWWRKGRELI